MTLYELKNDITFLRDMLEDPEADLQTIKDTMQAVKMEFHDKADGYAIVMAEGKATMDALKEQEIRLATRRKTIENNLSRMKQALQDAMEETGETKFKTTLFSFGIQNNPASVVIDDATKIPQNFLIPQEPKIDKAAIKELLKETSVSWAHTEQTRGLRIR